MNLCALSNADQFNNIFAPSSSSAYPALAFSPS